MTYLLSTFKVVSLIFAIAAIATGTQAIVNPVGFSRSFGLPVTAAAKDADESRSKHKPTVVSYRCNSDDNPVESYVALMGIRQLATGMTLLIFAYQQKWTEMATILNILGIVVAGTDGIYLARSGAGNQAKFHAIPGALIALLAGTVVLTQT